MKKTLLTATFVMTFLAAGSSFARSVQNGAEYDLLYGNSNIEPVPSQPVAVSGPVQNGSEYDVLYNVERYEPTQMFQKPERLADDRDLSTDLIYGS